MASVRVLNKIVYYIMGVTCSKMIGVHILIDNIIFIFSD